MGKEFRFILLENYSSPQKISFAVSFETVPAQLFLKSLNSPSTIFNQTIYTKDTIITLNNITTVKAFSVVDKAEETIRNISLVANSNVNFSLTVLNNALLSSDIANIIPTEKTPYNPIYYVNTYKSDRNNGSLFGIVALDDNCTINILPTAESEFRNRPANVPYTVNLNKGQMYMVRAIDTFSFAGTKLWNSNGCKRFSVFEGSKSSTIDYSSTCQGSDHLYNQTRPLQYLGKSFTTLPFQDLSGGYYAQIVFTANNTELFVDGISQGIFNERDVKLINNINNTSLCISATMPISIIQLMKSANCNGSTIGNPSIMTVLPNEQLTQLAQFALPTTLNLSPSSTVPSNFYLGIVCPINTLKNLRLNTLRIDTSSFIRNCNFAIGSVKLNANLGYQLTSVSGFLAYVYANGKDESYASEIGGGFENKITEIKVEPNITSTCDTFYQFKLKAKSDSIATFNWQFGDGTSATGDSVAKAYNKVGKFNLTVVASYNSNTGCKNDTFNKELTVFTRPFYTLGKDTQLCEGNIFALKPLTPPKVKFLWYNNTTNNTLNIGNSRKVWLTLTDTNNCSYTDTIQLNFINCDTNNIKLPNVFTPGTIDDKNDEFAAEFTGFNLLEGYIYNRWGILVYNFEYPKNNYWNGCVKNDISTPCPSGTYYYIYKFTNTKTRLTKNVNGVVQLIR